jgi:hypothetical protein
VRTDLFKDLHLFKSFKSSLYLKFRFYSISKRTKGSQMEKKIEILNIFDFDGTMFRSPVPNPALWDSKMVGKIKEMPSTNGYGWFQDIVTLSEPAVPKNPGMEWWNDIIVKEVVKSIENPKSRTALLTGRTDVFMDQIKSFAKTVGLQFDDYGLAPSQRVESTMQFKQGFIRKLISTHEPKEINIYDDRPKQAVQFEAFFKKEYPKIKTNVVFVKAVETFLKPNIEIEVVKILKEKYRPHVDWVASCRFTGVVIDSESKGILKSYFPPVESWKPYYEHMTICLGLLSRCTQLSHLPETIIGTEVKLTVTHVGKSDDAYAVRVTVGMESINQFPHITMCVHPTSKPQFSNYIQNWKEVKEELILTGVIEEVDKIIKEVESKSPNGGGSGKKGGKGSNNNSPHSKGRRNDDSTPTKLDQGKMPAKGKFLKDNTKLSGSELKLAVTVLEEWLEKENIEYIPKNLKRIEEFVKENWSQ